MTWLAAALLVVQLNGSPADADISARYWFNNPPYRLNDQREVIILFFKTSQKEDAKTKDWIVALNRLQRKPDVVVIALSPDSRQDVSQWIQRHQIKFTVGARSPSVEDFKIKEFPIVRKFDRKSRQLAEHVMTTGQVNSFLPTWKSSDRFDPDLITEPWQLMLFVESDADGFGRQDALWKLYKQVEAEDFLDYAESRSRVEGNPWVRGTLNFLMAHARNGNSRPHRDLNPSIQYDNSYSENPNAEQWRLAKEYQSTIDQKSLGQFVEDYWHYSTEQPHDVLIRSWIVSRLENGREDLPVVRQALMEMVQMEPDPSIRLHIVGGLMQVCEVGDQEVARLLDDLAASETDLLHVKPTMEYTSHYLKTGQEDANAVHSQSP